jgi:hypothetical protein
MTTHTARNRPGAAAATALLPHPRDESAGMATAAGQDVRYLAWASASFTFWAFSAGIQEIQRSS